MNSGQPGIAGTIRLFRLCVVLLLALMGRYGYMRWYVRQTSGQLEVFQQQKVAKDAQLAQIKSSPNYKKLQTAVALNRTLTQVPWSQQIRIIRNLLSILDRYSTDQIQLSDFQVTLEKIALKGKVSDLSLVYGSGGVIDTFIRPNLVKNLQIQKYQRLDQFFDFTLQALINVDGITQTKNFCG